MIHFKDIKIRKKILILVFTMVALMAVIGVVGYRGVLSVATFTKTMLKTDAKLAEYSARARANVHAMRQYEKDIIINVAIKDTAKMTDQYKKWNQEYDNGMEKIVLMEKITSGIGDKDSTKNVKEINEMKKLLIFYHDGFVKLYENITARKITTVEHAYTAVDPFRQEARKLTDMSKDFSYRHVKEMNAVEGSLDTVRSRSAVLILAFILTAITSSLLIGLYISGNINRAAALVMDVTDRLSAGDLTGRVTLDQEDEFGMMSRSLNKSMDSMENLVSEIIVSMQMLNRAVEEISSGNQNLSQRSSEQASSIEEIASTIEQAAATINQNSSNSQDANSMSIESLQMVEEGNRIVAQSVESINEISTYSHKIGDIIAVINEIAFQTNLLALNAAVEAARAGEQGRGFAVVAGEVRNLAQRAGNASKEIEALIKTSIEKVTMGTELSNKSGEALDRVVTSFEKLGRVVSEIAAASEEQRQGMDQINTAITELDSMTQQNAALVEETASASEEMGNQAQELLAMTEQFKVRSEVKNTVEKKNTRKSIEQDHGHAKSAGTHGGNGKARQISETPAGGSKDSRLSNIMEQEGFEQF